MNANTLWTLFKPDYISTPDSVDRTMKEELSSKNYSFLLQDQKEKEQFITQYSKIYNARLNQLSTVLKEQLENENVSERLSEASNVDNTEKTIIIGILYKKLKSHISYFKILDNPELKELYPNFKSFKPDQEDELYIEDSTGRRLLSLSNIELYQNGFKGTSIKNVNISHFVSGLIVAVKGKLLGNNSFQVDSIHLPGLVNQSPHKELSLSSTSKGNMAELLDQLKKGEKKNLVAFVSGLEMKSNNPNLHKIQQLKVFLEGGMKSKPICSIFLSINKLVVLGNSINVERGINLRLIGSYQHKQNFKEMFNEAYDTIEALNSFFKGIYERIGIVVLPGPKDPSDKYLPQNPFPQLYFPSQKKNTSFSLCSNPSAIEISGRNILLSSGQNTEDIKKFALAIKTDIDAMKVILYGRHFAPTAPHTLKTYPFNNSDELVLDFTPDIYVTGNCETYSETVLKENGVVCKLLTVPTFSDSGSLVLLDLETYKSYVMNFN